MKVVVQNFLKSAKRHVLDTDTGAIIDADEVASAQPPRGYFMRLGDTPVVFYAHRGKLHLRAGEDALPLAGVKVELAGDGLRTLRILKNEDVVLRVAYPNPVNPPMEFDLTMAEEEDFDLGLFVKNVLGSADRRKLVLAKWS